MRETAIEQTAGGETPTAETATPLVPSARASGPDGLAGGRSPNVTAEVALERPSSSTVASDSADEDAPRSPSLGCGLSSPMPGGFTAGYAADTGLDIAGIKMAVYAIGAGEVEYAEAGHSLWTGPHDTDLAIRIRLDEPLEWDGRRVTHVWYAHLSALAFEQPEGTTPRRHVEAGERLGTSGVANGAWHLHLGLLLDGDTSQHWGTFLLEDDVRRVLCGLRARQRLPALASPATPRVRRLAAALAD
jgi:murein DD-endopeptidase MepM/ murein hydrolase activator NlpD